MEFLDANGLKTLCNEIKKYVEKYITPLQGDVDYLMSNAVDQEEFKKTLGVYASNLMTEPGWQGQPYDSASVDSVLQQLARYVSSLEANCITSSNLRTIGGQSLLKGPGLDNNIPLPDTSEFVTNTRFEECMGTDDQVTYEPLGLGTVQDIIDNVDERISDLETNPLVLNITPGTISEKSQLSNFKNNDIVFCTGELDPENAGTNKSTVNKFIIVGSNNTYTLAPEPYNIYNSDGSSAVNLYNLYVAGPVDGHIYMVMKNTVENTEKLDLVNINKYFAEFGEFYEEFNTDFGDTFGIPMGTCFNWEGSDGLQLQPILDEISAYINSFKSKLNYVEVFIDGLDNGVPKISQADLEKINNNNPSYIIINGSWCKMLSRDSFTGHFTIADSNTDFSTTVYSGMFAINLNTGDIVVDQGAAENLDEKFQYKLTNKSQLATINGQPLYYGGNIKVTTDLSGIEQAINEQNLRIDALEQKINALTETVNNLNK